MLKREDEKTVKYFLIIGLSVISITYCSFRIIELKEEMKNV